MLLAEQPFPFLALIATETRRSVGIVGEQIAARMFEEAGYGVVPCRNRSRRGDLLVIDQHTGEIFRVEVKTARLAKDNRYHFTLVKSGRTDYHDAQFVLLLALSPTGYPVPFLIPVADIPARRSIQFYGLPDTYSGKWSSYRVRGSLVLEGN